MTKGSQLSSSESSVYDILVAVPEVVQKGG
jgi:hypothetical protein